MQQHKYIKDPRLAGIVCLLIYLLPITLYPLVLSGTGIFDWDTGLQRNTALYLSYMKYSQIPGNNPWIGGGIPLSPTVPVYGLNAFYTLLYGPASGMLASVVTYFVLGYWGALKFIGNWTQDRHLQVFFCAVLCIRQCAGLAFDRGAYGVFANTSFAHTAALHH